MTKERMNGERRPIRREDEERGKREGCTSPTIVGLMPFYGKIKTMGLVLIV
jgi:hypothetical protein